MLAIVTIVIFLLTVLAWLIMLAAGNVGLALGFQGALPFAALFFIAKFIHGGFRGQ